MQPPRSIDFHPALAGWFARSFGQPTDVQLQAWEAIAAGRHTLIAAPTGSGKTLAAFLPCLDRLVKAKDGKPETRRHGVRIVYVTPLKALNNDIHHHLIRFAEEIDAFAAQEGIPWPGVRCAVRTGDTTPSQRASMLRRPPDVLVTTPESLYLLLTSEKGRDMLRTAEQVIVDEIHELAADKRGAHLSLTMERLVELTGRRLQRIGVSATQKPLERVARFLGGWEEAGGDARTSGTAAGWAQHKNAQPEGARDEEAQREGMQQEGVQDADAQQAGTQQEGTQQEGVHDEGAHDEGAHAIGAQRDKLLRHPLGYAPRPVTIVESMMRKSMSATVTMPDFNRPMQTRDAVWLPLLERVMQLMHGSKSVIIFVNSRRLCERLCLRLNEFAGYEIAHAHHGSVSRERRHEVERRLKAGELRCIVATSSLELGIDIGHVDLVIQIDAPPDAASGIQRIGRAGHAVGGASRGVIIARQRGQLPEAAVLARLIRERDIEEIRVPRNAVDVLSQQVVAMAAVESWEIGRLHRLITRSDSYRTFDRETLEEMLQVLGGFYPFARPLLTWDRESGTIAGRSNTPMAAVAGAGTIPQSAAYPVYHAESRTHLGELDEEFVQESRTGDVFQLGSSLWMIRGIQNDRVYVAEAGNRFGEIPFWRNEAGSRSYDLSLKIGAFLRELEERLGLETPTSDKAEADGRIADWLAADYGMDALSAEKLIALVREQHRVCALPTDRRIVIEHYKDLTGRTHVIVHNPFGRRVNRAWLLAIEKRLERLLSGRPYGNAKDNGLELVLPEWDASWLQAIWSITPSGLAPLLGEAVSGSPLLAVAFRRIAETSLLLARSFKRTPMWQMRLRSEELLKAALPYAARFPYLRDAVKECLYDYLDTEHLTEMLKAVRDGRMAVEIRETPYPSPFAEQFIADYANMQLYEGDGLSETVQLQLMNVSKAFTGQLFGAEPFGGSILPKVAAEEERKLSAPDREPRNKDDLYDLLKRRGDLSAAELVRLAGDEALKWLGELEAAGRIVPVDPAGTGEYRWICADEREMYREFPETETSRRFIIGRFIEHRLSFTEPELCERYPRLSHDEARRLTDTLLAEKRIVRAPFAERSDERLFSSASVASRIVRLSIGELRKRAAPAEPMRWCGQAALLQHALHGTRLRGTDGLRETIGRLQGIYLPLSAWESVVFPARLDDYRKEDLDLLCASGEVVWLGRKEEGEKEGRVAFFLSDADPPLYAPFVPPPDAASASRPGLLEQLKRGGASFLTKLSRDADLPPSEALAGLMELAWEGLASNDQFAPLRLKAETKAKQWARTGSGQGRWYWTGTLRGGGTGPDVETSAVQWVHHLLGAFGMISKELVNHVSPYSWDVLLPVLKRLEEWGTLTRGMLVKGIPAYQFTTPEMAEAVRRPLPDAAADAITVISAVDPANPFGLMFEWPEAKGPNFARKPGNFIVLQGDRWLFWIEGNGRRIHTMDAAAGDGTGMAEEAKLQALKHILGTIMRRQRMTKIAVHLWDGEAAAEADAGRLLRALGAERDRTALVLWASQLRT
ncbi:DEAD/DEAH box helicase [Paenibacillus cisolokensis]|uniref:DEAD/DEAH box helicase n=1 Tax=Paenibacillus cisolokensis TaxID=1658519 RepID=UPI003D2A0AFC